ncbi:1,4-alpha-glucan branching protein GlgB [Coprococcus eutactus]|jgi:1,4-alpha-glucan branching enzyme|uniref:1,4-alpha-glucan branching enzyme n=2 Tax=Coprococcus TaxID=33042 RepID=A0A8I0DTV6_9FIRM|nr:1,4-alpha-glucan branching protein GlgB [Coprococcus hominis (ex Liu et al. 2022)]NSE53556.1 1,4-alpha-glucan branching protein GlgB [Coprococcus eutactus]RHV77578.1 1,4-alpha-glucan branching protein GlgB [Clostridium sp. OF10-22XD]SCG99509.1 1%2C4-alpha-glucan branching enzyme GlgB [uncultured Coprococcus sp.]
MDIYEFYSGRSFDAYRELGAHVKKEVTGKKTVVSGVEFVTYAPNALGVNVIGEFNDWNETVMERCYDGSFFKVFVPEARPGMMYKYKIYHRDGSSMEHCDPYGFGMELRPAFASIIRDMDTYRFHDAKWMKNRSVCQGSPLNIYEVHLGSWRTKPVFDEQGNPLTPEEIAESNRVAESWYTYKEIAPMLAEYVKEQGYNYVEFMPLSEHPSDQSWGYQNTGFFSPTSRYGTADDLKEMIDILHQHNIGTILDFVPVHFALDGYGLARYDGTALYEYPSNDVGYSEWGSMNFIHSKGEVRSFLQSAANYWLSEYHFDGLRMDAISRIIYWMGDESRGVNDRAVDFIRNMNQGLKDRHPSIILCAEDSTDFKGTTKETKYGGLGFDYKWDMGWMNDTLNFFRTLPFVRGEHYHDLTFSMMYNYNERYLLPLSHDEVVHGKATIIQKMAGMYEEKFPQAKALYAYMYAHPGKKLNFMGNEIGQFREWDEKREQDWDLLKYPNHDSFHQYMKALNKIYMKEPALSAWDDDPNGFAWILCGKENDVVYIFQREVNEDKVIVVLNLSGLVYKNYHFNYENGDTMKVLINSDWNKFGGSTKDTEKTIKGVNGDFGFDLPAFSGIYLKPVD